MPTKITGKKQNAYIAKLMKTKANNSINVNKLLNR